MTMPQILLGAAAVALTARTARSLVRSPKFADSRKSFLDMVTKTIVARPAHELSLEEVTQAKQIHAYVEQLSLNAQIGWSSDSDMQALGHVSRYLPAARAKIFAKHGIALVDSMLLSAIGGLQRMRPAQATA